MSTKGVKTLSSLTVCCVDVTVSSPCTDQDGPSALRALHEGQVPDGTVMHAELQVWPLIRGAHWCKNRVRSISGDSLITFHYFFLISANHFDGSNWTPFQKETNAHRKVGDHYLFKASKWPEKRTVLITYTLKHIKAYLWHCSCLH